VQELEAGPVHRFGDWPNDQVPKRAAGVYTVWDGDRLLYVGMSGRAMAAEDLEVSPNGRSWPRACGLDSTRIRLAAAPGTSSVCMSATASSSRPSPHLSSSSSPAAGCRWTTSPEGSSATASPTGSSSPSMGPRPRGWRQRFDEGRSRWEGRI
jgi:hypothetical protein